jgi:ElaB/YqjD/DUF883 family membrane-anchored ribosome-binding protein
MNTNPNTAAKISPISPTTETIGNLSERVGHSVEVAKQKVREGVETAKQKLTESSEKLGEKAEALKSKVADGVEVAKEHFAATQETVSDLLGDVATSATQISERVGTYVRANPGKSIALAVAAGVLLSKAFGSRAR